MLGSLVSPSPPSHTSRYQEAAISFSQSQLSFEEVALKFIQVDRSDALKTFLIKKLLSLRREVSGCGCTRGLIGRPEAVWVWLCSILLAQDKAQQTMLTTWLIELFLNELGTLSDTGERRAHKRLQQEFHVFLSQDYLKVSGSAGHTG
jgi:hypothetical protein